MARSASSDHLASMRSSCHCNCDLEDRRGMSRSVGSLYDMVEERQDCHLDRVQSGDCAENMKRKKSEDHVYVNCESGDHVEAYNSLMRLLMMRGQAQRTYRRKTPRRRQRLSSGCISVSVLFGVFLTIIRQPIHHSMIRKSLKKFIRSILCTADLYDF